MESITFKPVAVVESRFDTNTPAEELRGQVSRLVFAPDFEPGLLGLESGMDIVVLFFLHGVQPEQVHLQLHPRHNPANPIQGVFATRTQFRPNPVGLTVAHIEAVAGRVVTVRGLDALNGAPVLDVKPFAPYFDADTSRQQLEVREVSSLAEARQAIDGIDAEIIRLLGNRAGYVRQVVKYKKTAADVRAPARYAEVMRRRRELAAAAGLNPDVIEAMYRLLVDSFIKEEMEMLELKDEG